MSKFEAQDDGPSTFMQVMSVVVSTLRAVRSVLELPSTVGSQYRHARFGAIGDILYLFRIVNTDFLRDTHWNINFWTDAEVLAWKTSFVSTCNAIAVAVSAIQLI